MTQSDEQVTRIFAIRHGQTDWNVDGRIQGQLDIGLNATGQRQVECAARALADEGLGAIYASDLRRAMQTATAISLGCGLNVTSDAGLRERGFGTFEGMTFQEIRDRWPQLSERWRKRDPAFGAPGGETLSDFYRRSVQSVERLAANHAGQAIAIVSHGGVMDCLYRAASRVALDAPRSWQLSNASINRLLYTPQGLTLVGWDDRSHLDDLDAPEFKDDAPRRTSGAA